MAAFNAIALMAMNPINAAERLFDQGHVIMVALIRKSDFRYFCHNR